MPGASSLHHVLYWASLAVVMGGALFIVTSFAEDLPGLVDIATTISFMSAPVFAYINYLAVTHPSVPPEYRPPQWLRVFTWIGLVCLTLFSVFYLVWRFW